MPVMLLPKTITNMTKRELRMLYKRETGNPAVMDNGRRQTKIPDDYRVFLDYFDWLEEELIKHINLKKKLIPWESLK